MFRRRAAVVAAVVLGSALGVPACAGATAVGSVGAGAAVKAKPKPTPVRCAKGKVANRVRVTIKVRRRYRSVVTGRMRTRTVRRKVWRTRCVTARRKPATSAPTTPGTGTGTSTGTGTPTTVVPPPVLTPPGPVIPAVPDCSGSNISMNLREYSVTTTRGCVAAGSVNVDVLNFGQDPHNLALRPAAGGSPAWVLPGPDATSELAAGDHLHQTVTIPAGKWIVYCSLPGHEDLGMKAELEAR